MENEEISRIDVQLNKLVNQENDGASLVVAPHSLNELHQQNNSTSVNEESTTNIQSDVLKDNEVGDSEDDNFKTICRECVIRDIVGCIQCGLYQYGLNHKYFNIKVVRL